MKARCVAVPDELKDCGSSQEIVKLRKSDDVTRMFCGGFSLHSEK